MLSSIGASFKTLIDQWDEVCLSDAKRNQISIMVEGQNFVLFFLYHNEVFGAQEPHRVTFARMLHPDEETSEEWIREANFMAVNLSKAVMGQTTQQIFKAKDLDDIKILNKDKTIHLLTKQVESMSQPNFIAGIKNVMQAMMKPDSKE